jgi:hypothetical protein
MQTDVSRINGMKGYLTTEPALVGYFELKKQRDKGAVLPIKIGTIPNFR